MSWSAELQSAKQEMTRLLRRGLSQLFLWTLTAKASATGDNDAVQSGDDGVDPGAPTNEQKGQRKVVRVQPWGHNGVPPQKLRSLSLRLGSSNLFWIGIGPTQAYGPQNMKTGETAVYAEPGQLFYLDSNGNLIATPVVVNGTQGTVQLGGSAHPLPLWDTFEADLADALSTIVSANGGGNVLSDGGVKMAKFLLNLTGAPLATKTYNSKLATNG